MIHESIQALGEFLQNTSFYAYLIVFGIGLLWIAIGLLLGGLTSMVELIHDIAVDASGDTDPWGHQQVGLSPVSPLMLAVFGMLFGASGMTLTAFTALGAGIVLLLTVIIAVGLDAGVYYGLVQFFVKSQSTSLAHSQDAVGGTATVATRVAPGMMGTIDYEIMGRRAVASARTADERTHEAGDVVRIVSMDGGVARVAKKEP